MQKQFILSEGLRDAIVGYMQTRPYQEVAQGIANLMNLPQLPTEQQSDQEPPKTSPKK